MRTRSRWRTTGLVALVVGVLAGLLPFGSPASAATGIGLGVQTSFESVNYPGFYMRHRFSLGEITPVSSNLDQQDAKFVLRPALSGTADAVSFESVNYPGYYLRHQGYQIKLHRNGNTDLFRKDASLVVRQGLNGQAAFGG